QKAKKLMPDGIVGEKTLAALGITPNRETPAKLPSTTKIQQSWPRQQDVETLYGAPANPACTAGTVRLPVAMRIAWNLNQTIKSFPCHSKVEAAMTAIFAETIKHYGEAKWRALGLD